MDNYDKILKDLLKKTSENMKREDCLSEELLASYLDNLLDNKERETVEGHLYKCNYCRQHSIILNRIRKELKIEGLMSVPQQVTDRAKELVRAGIAKRFFEVVLEFAKDSVRIIKDTGAMYKPLEFAAEGARQEAPAGLKNIALLSNTFKELQADIIIERIDDIFYEIIFKASDIVSGSPIDDIRVSLVSGEREVASYLTANGKVSFKNLYSGRYLLNIIKDRDIIGEILLKLESSK